uniref:Uncharacterized protein n=1 Tax=Arundo donax TaxID=35708 RepID=A0A0A8Z2Z3_ARUDO
MLNLTSFKENDLSEKNQVSSSESALNVKTNPLALCKNKFDI